MKKVIIDGVEYIPVTPEVKEERLSGWIKGVLYRKNSCITLYKESVEENTRMIQINEGEIIVSEADVKKAWAMCTDAQNHYEHFIKLLGFKKDGV